jgi:hypothetical protein
MFDPGIHQNVVGSSLERCVGPGSQCVMGSLANRDEISVFYVPIAAAGDRLERVYSVEKLSFGAEAIFQFCGNAAENLRKTRRTAD